MNVKEFDLAEQFMNTPSEAHSFQDGVTVGVMIILAVAESTLLPAVLVALGLGTQKIGRRKILEKVEGMVRINEIRDAPEYFLGGIISGAIVSGAAVFIIEQIIIPAL